MGDKESMKYFKKYYNKIENELYLKMDFKNHEEFELQFLRISIGRGLLLHYLVILVSIYSFYLDYYYYRKNNIDIIYRINLFHMHIAIFLLAIVFILIYTPLKKSHIQQRRRFAKTVILMNLFVTIFLASLISLNSQRYTGNIYVYMFLITVVSMAVPLYPRWVMGIYVVNHMFFMIGLVYACDDTSVMGKLLDSTTAAITSLILFLLLYRHNVKNFLNDAMLKEDKISINKVIEINPFPLLIARMEDGKILYTNDKALLFYDIPKEQADPLYLYQFYVNASDLSIIYETLKSTGKVVDFITEQRTLSGTKKNTMINYVRIDYFGEECILSGIIDIAAINQVKENLTIHATIDELTGVLNRRVGMDLLNRKFEAAKKKGIDFSVCFLDIDDLKIVNDKFGHLEGDLLIADICQVIKEEINSKDLIFRYGGDEFVIIFQDLAEEELKLICSRIEHRVKELTHIKKKPYPVSVSIGVFTHKAQMHFTLDQLIEKVDMNMYQIKLKKKSNATAPGQ